MGEAAGRRVPGQTFSVSPHMPSTIHSGDSMASDIVLSAPLSPALQSLGPCGI